MQLNPVMKHLMQCVLIYESIPSKKNTIAGELAWYAELVLSICLYYLLRKTGARLNLNEYQKWFYLVCLILQKAAVNRNGKKES
jgi:hypothetical protein